MNIRALTLLARDIVERLNAATNTLKEKLDPAGKELCGAYCVYVERI
jgi:hypothetical protein